MWMICKKELSQFFSSLTGYIVITVFLAVNGLVLFFFEDNIFSFGYASLDRFFSLAPWVLLLLIPAVTMRSLPDEFKTGTFEVLRTLPLTPRAIVWGKFLGSFCVVIMALLPTFIYVVTIQHFAVSTGVDAGETAGAYLGLFFLAAVFTAIGICAGSFTNNAVVAFVVTIVVCVLLYYGFNAFSKIPSLGNGVDYYIEMAGIDFHYSSISRGVIDSRDILYFLSLVGLLMFITERNIIRKQ